MNECVTLDLHWYYTRTNDSSVRCRAIYLVFFACDRWLGEWWSVHQCLLSYMTDNLLNYPFLIIYPQDEILIDSIDSNAYWASRHRSPCQIPVCFVSFLLLQSTSMTDVLHCYPHITVVILANMLENDTFSWIFNVQRSHTLIGLPRKGIMCFLLMRLKHQYELCVFKPGTYFCISMIVKNNENEQLLYADNTMNVCIASTVSMWRVIHLSGTWNETLSWERTKCSHWIYLLTMSRQWAMIKRSMDGIQMNLLLHFTMKMITLLRTDDFSCQSDRSRHYFDSKVLIMPLHDQQYFPRKINYW
jgi:hypothetical protein